MLPDLKNSILFLSAICVAAAIEVSLLGAGIVINSTPSLPIGIYKKRVEPIAKGCFVLFRLPNTDSQSRPYARNRLIKEIAAMEGDRVTVSPKGVFVNGLLLRNSAQKEVDIDGVLLPRFSLNDYQLKSGELLTMSTFNPRSFDSRYFGPVTQNSIIAVVSPVFVWKPYE